MKNLTKYLLIFLILLLNSCGFTPMYKLQSANFYFSKPGQIPSFLDHSHPYDVIAKQIYGNSTWRVNDKKIKLKKNYSLIIPANAIHSVIDKSNKKLSLTINIEEGRSS